MFGSSLLPKAVFVGRIMSYLGSSLPPKAVFVGRIMSYLGLYLCLIAHTYKLNKNRTQE
jgi:hypothetical protein